MKFVKVEYFQPCSLFVLFLYISYFVYYSLTEFSLCIDITNRNNKETKNNIEFHCTNYRVIIRSTQWHVVYKLHPILYATHFHEETNRRWTFRVFISLCTLSTCCSLPEDAREGDVSCVGFFQVEWGRNNSNTIENGFQNGFNVNCWSLPSIAANSSLEFDCLWFLIICTWLWRVGVINGSCEINGEESVEETCGRTNAEEDNAKNGTRKTNDEDAAVEVVGNQETCAPRRRWREEERGHDFLQPVFELLHHRDE